MSFQNGQNWDIQAKRGRIAELTGKMGGKGGSENPIVDPHRNVVTSAGSWLQFLEEENLILVSQLKGIWNLNTRLFQVYVSMENCK